MSVCLPSYLSSSSSTVCFASDIPGQVRQKQRTLERYREILAASCGSKYTYKSVKNVVTSQLSDGKFNDGFPESH